jgi:sugar phosphate isomerase/epimerase
MQIGIGTYALAWSIGVPGSKPSNPMDIYQFMDFVRQQGISLVQIADNLPLHTFSTKELKQIYRRSQELEIKIEVGTRGLRPDHIRRYLEIASSLDSPILRVVIDSKDFTPEIHDIKKIINDLLPDIIKMGIRLAIENHERLTSEQFLEIIKHANSDLVGICLDPVNSIGADEGFDTVFTNLAPYTINLHLKDYLIRRKSHMMGFDIYGTPAGQGMMPIRRVVETLKTFGKTESIILELWPPPEDTIPETIRKEKIWVGESIAYLNTLPV